MTLLDSALEYETRGWSVVQLLPKGKKPPHGFEWVPFQKRCATPDEIKQWWADCPGGNIGIITGSISGIAVIDIDDISKADERVLREMPTGYQVTTGSGMTHAYYKIPEGIVIQSRHILGVELKAEGSLVVAPPSIHPDTGKPYLVKYNGELGTLPQWFLDVLSHRIVKPTDFSNLWEGVLEGERNNAAAKLAGRYFGKNLSRNEIVTILDAWNKNNKPPLEGKELLSIINSIEQTHKRNNPEEAHCDKEAEDAVISLMISDNSLIPIVIDLIGYDSKAFVFMSNRILYESIISMDKPCDPITLGSELRSRGEDVSIPYIPTASLDNIHAYCDIVRQSYIKRKLVSSSRIISNIASEPISVEEMIVKAQEVVLSFSDVMEKSDTTIKEQCDKAYDKLQRLNDGEYVEIPTGFKDLDFYIGGLHRQRYHIIAGLPSVGKSAYIHNILYYVSVERKIPSVLFCYESNATAVILRMVSLSTGVDITYGAQNKKDIVLAALSKISKSPLIIIDNCPPSIEYAVAHTEKLKVEHPNLAVAVYDHLHLMSANIKQPTQEQVISKISNSLKGLAKQLNIAVIGVSQLSRASIRRQDTRPMLDDLRSSGSLEAGADVVGFIYREDYYDSVSDSPTSPTELIIRKQKDGPIGTLSYTYHRNISKFEEM